MLAEFRGFLTKTNALALAVGVIIGAAAGTIVTSLVGDILMPVVSLFLPSGDWRQAKIVLTAATDANGEVAILYGRFIGTLVNFFIVSLVVFFVVKLLVKPVPVPPAEPMKQCGECLEMIPAEARRCRACATVVAPG